MNNIETLAWWVAILIITIPPIILVKFINKRNKQKSQEKEDKRQQEIIEKAMKNILNNKDN